MIPAREVEQVDVVSSSQTRQGLETAAGPGGASGIERAKALNALAWDLRYEDAGRAEALAEEALDILSSLVPSPGDCGGPAEPLPLRASILGILGEVQADLGKHELAITRLLEAWDIYEGLGDPGGLVTIRLSLGRVYYYLADYPEAARHYTIALQKAEALGDRYSAARAILNLGLCYYQGKDLPTAYASLEKALVDFRELGRAPGQFIALDGLANAHLSQANFSTALDYATQALALGEGRGIELNMTGALCTAADALVGLGRNEEALAMVEKAVAFAQERGIVRGQVEAQRRWGDILRRLGRTRESLEVLERAARTAEAVGILRLRWQVDFDYATALRESGRWEDAYERFQSFHDLKEAAATFDAEMKLKTLAALHRVESARREAEFHRSRSEALEKEVAESRVAQAELERLAVTDPLTGLLNRRDFFESLEAEVARARRYDRALSVLMIDVDHFKNVNDTMGHRAGDSALVAVSRRLELGLRDSDIACRYGGEEFAILLPETDLAEARLAAERLRVLVSTGTVAVSGRCFNVTVSVGVARLEAGESGETFLERSDRALYRAKAQGRDRVETA
jgi:diguanylate cyclase (GGDEF)-like protein